MQKHFNGKLGFIKVNYLKYVVMNIIMFDDKYAIKNKEHFEIGVPQIAKDTPEGYIKFTTRYSVNKIFRYFTDTRYPARLLEDNYYKFPIIEKMGFFEMSGKHRWEDLKRILPDIVYKYKIIKKVKNDTLMLITPLSYEESIKIEKPFLA